MDHDYFEWLMKMVVRVWIFTIVMGIVGFVGVAFVVYKLMAYFGVL